LYGLIYTCGGAMTLTPNHWWTGCSSFFFVNKLFFVEDWIEHFSIQQLLWNSLIQNSIRKAAPRRRKMKTAWGKIFVLHHIIRPPNSSCCRSTRVSGI
jgi:hypothetical protein